MKTCRQAEEMWRRWMNFCYAKTTHTKDMDKSNSAGRLKTGMATRLLLFCIIWKSVECRKRFLTLLFSHKLYCLFRINSEHKIAEATMAKAIKQCNELKRPFFVPCYTLVVGAVAVAARWISLEIQLFVPIEKRLPRTSNSQDGNLFLDAFFGFFFFS